MIIFTKGYKIVIFHSLSNLFEENQSYDHPVAMRNGEPITFNKFQQDVASFAARYNNCRAALICEDSYYFIVGFFGLLYGNSSVIMSSAGQTSITQIIKQECEVIIDDDKVKNLPISNYSLSKINPEIACIDFFTSGSTGLPKRVTKSLSVLEKEINTLDKILSQKPGTVFSTVPHYHLYGFVSKLLWPLASRHPFDVLMHNFWENLLAELTPDSIIVTSPVHLRRLEGVAPISEKNIPAQIISAGSQLSAANVEEIKKVLKRIPNEFFGSTETGGIAIRFPDYANKPWQPLDSILLQQENDGRMKILSPHIGENWYLTEDVVELVEGGFNFLGRADGIVKVEGRRVSLVMVENELCKLPYILEAVVTLLPDKAEQLAAIVKLSKDGEEQLSILGNFRFSRLLRKSLGQNIERISMPRVWRFVNSIPAHGIGKRRKEDIYNLLIN